ncbi:MAG: helix-turn-helix domain-containing protein [Thermomicrobiales bacterium]
MQQEEPRFSLAELVEASGVAERTIRSYITDGLVPAAIGRGRARYFTPGHLARLELVARLRADRLSIDEIRDRFDSGSSASDLESDTWRRLELHPDLELHVRADAPESVQALASELAQHARRWFGEP